MSTQTQAAPLTFDRFWRWLKDHSNCLLRVGTADTTLFDHDDLHWDFFDDDEGSAVVQLIRGKVLVGELAIDKGQVSMVQPSPDVEDTQAGSWIFELVGGPRQDGAPLCYFHLSHGVESPAGHQDLKH